jgi:hypothetical protein
MQIIRSKKGIHVLRNRQALRPIKGLTSVQNDASIKHKLKGAK